MVSSKFKSINPSSTVSLNNRFSELKERGENVISFGVGEPDMTTPLDIIEFAMNKAKEGGTHYTPSKGIRELREKVAEKYTGMTKKEIQVNNVIVTPAKFALNLAVESVIENGDNVLIQDPSFLSYPEIIRIAGGVTRYIPSRDDGSLDVEAMKEMVDSRTKMIILNSPSNPNGWVASREQLRDISEIAVDKKIFVVSDEIYEHIVYDGEHISILSFPGMEERTFIVNGFSKSHAMTGWRIGYLIAPPEFVPYIDAYQQHTITCAPSISQYAALKAMEDVNFPKEMRNIFLRRRNALHSILSQSGRIEMKKPAGTFYAFPRLLNGMDGDAFSARLLDKEKVLVTPGSAFGPSGKNRVRLSFALKDDQLEEGAKRIVEFLNR
jgi:aspartate aminotransferase